MPAPQRKLHLTNSKGRNATIVFGSVKPPKGPKLGVPSGEVRFLRYFAATPATLHEALQGTLGDDYAQALIDGDPEVDMEQVGREIGETSKVYLSADGKVLHVFGVHLPSGGNPFVCRDRAMNALNETRRALPPDALAIAGGDFNLNCSESQGDLFSAMLRYGKWGAPPEVAAGCGEPGSSKHQERRVGTYFTWSFLDFFLVSENMLSERPVKSGWYANLGSFRTSVGTAAQIQTNDDGYVSPRRFDPKTGSGASDHWPVMIDLVTRQ